MPNPDTVGGSLLVQWAAGLLIALTIFVVAWIRGPPKWPVHNRRLRKLLSADRECWFVYSPAEGSSKTITFNPDGSVGEGRNSNEDTWRIKRGRLEILAHDGRPYSRFRFDQSQGRLVHTNDADARSTLGQYFVPKFESWRRE